MNSIYSLAKILEIEQVEGQIRVMLCYLNKDKSLSQRTAFDVVSPSSPFYDRFETLCVGEIVWVDAETNEIYFD